MQFEPNKCVVWVNFHYQFELVKEVSEGQIKCYTAGNTSESGGLVPRHSMVIIGPTDLNQGYKGINSGNIWGHLETI